MAHKKSKKSLEYVLQHLGPKESIINGISEALILIDAKNYEIIDVNLTFLNLYGLNDEQVVGKQCFEMRHHISKPCSQKFGDGFCPLEKSVSTGTYCYFRFFL